MDGKDEPSGRGLKNILSKKKRGSRDDANSVFDSNSPTRDSKLSLGLGKLKEKNRRKSQVKPGESLEDLRDRSGTPKSLNSLGVSPSASTLSDERSSLLTSDSDGES